MHDVLRMLSIASLVLLILPFFVDAGTRPVWNRTLSFGLRGQDVVELQNTLIAQGDLAAGNNTGYFGRMTEAAVQKFQCRSGIVCVGTPATTGYGVVGPRTQARLLEGFGSEGTVPSDFFASPTSGSAPLTVSFNTHIARGMVDDGRDYSIDFGDGSQASIDKYTANPRVAHVYSAGTYTAKLIRAVNPCVKIVTCSSQIITEILGTVTVTVTSGIASNLSCTQDSQCPSSNYTCQAISGYGTACPSTNPSCMWTHTILQGQCVLKEGRSCTASSQCAAGFLCHAGICTNPIGNVCSGPSDMSCSAGWECAADCGPPVVSQYDPPVGYHCRVRVNPNDPRTLRYCPN